MDKSTVDKTSTLKSLIAHLERKAVSSQNLLCKLQVLAQHAAERLECVKVDAERIQAIMNDTSTYIYYEDGEENIGSVAAQDWEFLKRCYGWHEDLKPWDIQDFTTAREFKAGLQIMSPLRPSRASTKEKKSKKNEEEKNK